MELEKFFKKFNHDHPFILKEEHKQDEISVPPCCVVCGKKISSDPFYCCEENCVENIFVHKSCTELPKSIQHHLHPDHPLFLTYPLFLRSPSDHYGYSLDEDSLDIHFKCDACKRNGFGVHFYHCDVCNFILDLTCASIAPKSMEHPSHKHPLITTYRIILCFCDACGKKHEGSFYSCSTCDQFWIHEDCASLPTTYEDTHYHDHPLTLAYSLPAQYTNFGVLCEICETEVYSMLWVYHCGRCRFAFHVNCVTPQTEHFLSVLLPKKEFYSSRRKSEITNPLEDSDLGVVHLPLRDEFSSLADHLSKGIQLRATEKTTRFPANWHGQPLIRSFDDVQGSDTRLDILHDHEKYQKKLCNACIRPVTTTPFYKCVDKCNFILHESCAQLPAEIQHPFHSEHVLVLNTTKGFGYFFCGGCDFLCNGFRYSCKECRYHLDVICASLPITIRYEAHGNHTMNLKEKISRHCKACYFDRGQSTFAYRCGSCDFELHAICATYPSKLRHRNDDTHPYSLTYRHVEGHDSDYLCDICETEIDPQLWFYHCVECDKSIHADCHPTYDYRSRIKFRGILTIEGHDHPLITVPVIPMNTQCNGYVRVITEGTTCHGYEEAFDVKGRYHPVGFKCLECNYKIHYWCLRKLISEGVGYKHLRAF